MGSWGPRVDGWLILNGELLGSNLHVIKLYNYCTKLLSLIRYGILAPRKLDVSKGCIITFEKHSL